MTFFDENNHLFSDAKIINSEVEAEPFLKAAEVIVKLLATMGSAFTVVVKDIQGNVNKVRQKITHESITLQQIVKNELKQKINTATEGLIWLLRGLEFTAKGLSENLSKNEELSVSFGRAYEQTLSKYHNFMIRPIFGLAMKACPYRKDFYSKLSGGDDKRLADQIKEMVKALEERITVLNLFYSQENIKFK